MSLPPGTRLGAYEIVSKIGEGGMGQVFRARDTRLGRDVALKVLPELVGGDPDRVARFDREARALAALNHPNIAQVYDVGSEKAQGVGALTAEQRGLTPNTAAIAFLVMELVEGPTLAELIELGPPESESRLPEAERGSARLRDSGSAAERGGAHLRQGYGGSAEARSASEGWRAPRKLSKAGLPLTDALAIARQIADALEAAHEQGIIHRDLKPANIKVRADGVVKVLDFGLARIVEASEGAGGTERRSTENSPTLTARATQMGVILGSAAYMAPEQAKGKPADKRADIWAFGVVLYEMLTGRGPFLSETVPETLAHVMTREVSLSEIPADVPARIRKLIGRCLVKDPKQRLRDIGDARLILDDKDVEADALGHRSLGEGGHSALRTDPSAPRTTHTALWAASLAFVALAAAATAWFAKPSSSDSPTYRMSIALPPGEQITTQPAISPDGMTIAYSAGRSVSTSRLYVRRLDSATSRAIEPSVAAAYPFFSPDGRNVAFFSAGKLWRAPVDGGAPQSIVAAPRPWGGSWGTDNRIVFVATFGDGLVRVSADGGTPEPLTKTDDGEKGYAHVFPQVLPGGDILFTVWGKTFYVALLPAAGGDWQRVIPDNPASPTGIAAAGYLFVRDVNAGVQAARWAPDAGVTLVRPDTLVLESVNWIPGAERTWLAVSETGTAVYAPGDPGKRQLVWVDRQGSVTSVSGASDLDQITQASISNDGRRIAYTGYQSLWVRDLESNAKTRIRDDRRSFVAGWYRGDQRVAISSNQTGNWEMFSMPASGGAAAPLLTKPLTQHPLAVGPDGTIVFLDYAPTTGVDLWTLSPEGKAAPLVVTRFSESAPAFSPSGTWVAYQSDESGSNEVYAIGVQGAGSRVPGSASREQGSSGGERVVVSIDGGTGPVWSRDGKELFYRAGDFLMSAQVTSMSPLTIGDRKKLLDVSAFESMYFEEFDVSPDGRRFLFIRSAPEARATRLDVIVNWKAELQKIVK